MQTVFDWLTMALFSALVVVFLERSMDAARADDRLWHYAPPALGCALINQIGNAALRSGSPWMMALAVAGVAGVIAYGYTVLKVRPL